MYTITEGNTRGNFKENRNDWELVEENKVTQEADSIFNKKEIRCDIYRKKKSNGIYKYKKVKRY